jgi:hypothetical protein
VDIPFDSGSDESAESEQQRDPSSPPETRDTTIDPPEAKDTTLTPPKAHDPTPEPPDISGSITDTSGVDPDLKKAFWILVLVIKATLLLLTLGALLVYFRADYDFGGRLLLAGGALSLYAAYRYLRMRRRIENGEFESEIDETSKKKAVRPIDDVDAGHDESGSSASTLEEYERPAMTPLRTVRDRDGTHYLLLKESAESSLVRNPATGERSHLPNEELKHVDGESPLDTVLRPVSDDVVTLLTAVHDDRALALLLNLDTAGPQRVRAMLSLYDLCESDLHGMIGELRAAGLIKEETVNGERGYAITGKGSAALEEITG